MTQTERIMRHLHDHRSITQLEAFEEYGIMRLASRIAELRRDGANITGTMETRKNRYGEKVSYKRYRLEA